MKPQHTFVSDDRWSCSECGRTVLVVANPADTAFALRCCQERHGRLHAAARAAARRANPNPVIRPQMPRNRPVEVVEPRTAPEGPPGAATPDGGDTSLTKRRRPA